MRGRSLHPLEDNPMRNTHLISRSPVRQATGWAACAAATLLALGACGGGGGNSGSSTPVAEADTKAKVEAFTNYTRPDAYQTSYQPDLLVPMRDGFQLTCDLYLPAGADGNPAAGKFPSLMVSFQGYGRTLFDSGQDLRGFVKKGYSLLRCNTRGAQGIARISPSRPESVAEVNPFSPQEGQDGYDVIEWIAAQPWSTGKVGQIGTSYGGISTLEVAGLAPPHLAAVIPVLAAHDIYRDFATHNGVKLSTTSVGSETIPDYRGSWPVTCSDVTGEPTCSQRLPALWNAHPTFDDFWATRVVNLQNVKAPTLFVNGVKDFWMESQDRRWRIMNPRDDVAVVIGPWHHQNPDLENPEMQNMYLAWFDRWVAGIASAPMPPKATLQGPQAAGTKNWEGYAAWPPLASEVQRFYLAPAALQKEVPATGSAQLTTSGGTSQTLVFDSPAFATLTTLTGPIEVQLPLTFTATDANVVVNVMSRAFDGTLTEIGFPTFRRASHFESDATPTARVPGRVYTETFRVPSRYWTFQAGERMVVTISGASAYLDNDQPAGSISVSLGGDAFIKTSMLLR